MSDSNSGDSGGNNLPPAMAAAAQGQGSFSIGTAMSAGWNGFTSNAGLAIGIAVVYLIIHVIGSNIPFLNLIYSILVSFPLTAGVVLVGIRLADSGLGKESNLEFGNLFAGFSKYGTTMGAGWLIVAIIAVPTLVVVGIAVGLQLLVGGETAQYIAGGIILVFMIPLIYVSMRLFLVFYLIMDKNVGAIDSIKQSWEITEGHVLNLFLLSLLIGVVVIVGMLLLVVGIVPAMIIGMGAAGAAYRQIVGDAG